MRVSQRNLYSTFIEQFNLASSRLVELNQQASSQKKVNKPSDDPVGMARILGYRDSISKLSQYQDNINTAKGWLNLADETLMQVNNILTRCKEIAEEAATGTLTKSQRDGLSYEARQLLSQLVSLANTKYEGKSIFGGHKVNQNAFRETLTIDSNQNDQVVQYVRSISGNSTKTVLVQFLTDGTIGQDAIDYRYSADGGETWQTGQINAGDTSLNLGDTQVQFWGGYQVQANSATDYADTSGTWLWIRPTASYQGDVDSSLSVGKIEANNSNLKVWANGDFPQNVMVRVDNITTSGGVTTVTYSYSTDLGSNWTTGLTTTNTSFSVPGGEFIVNDLTNLNANDTFLTRSADLYANDPDLRASFYGNFERDVTLRIDSISGGTVTYSYSLDNGNNWSVGHTTNDTTFLVPGGRVEINDQTHLTAGDQIVVKPERARLEVEISDSEKVQINHVGRDVFGGMYKGRPVFGGKGKNLFETVGKLVGFLETNNQDGIQQALDNLKDSMEHISNHLASVGGRENRLEVADTVLSGLTLNEKQRMSKLEDVDIAELMTQLTNQQTVYQTILKSSAMIMRMNLADYI